MKLGDYVIVKPGVHDDSMPFNRRDGMIIEIVGQDGWDRIPDQINVLFSNNKILKFHKSQLEVISEYEQ